MTRRAKEAREMVIEGELVVSDIEKARRVLKESLNCLNASVVENVADRLKLMAEGIVFLEVDRSLIKNVRTVEPVVTEAVLNTYQEDFADEGAMVLEVAVKKYQDYYIKYLSGGDNRVRRMANEIKE